MTTLIQTFFLNQKGLKMNTFHKNSQQNEGPLSQKTVSDLLLGGILGYLESCPGVTQVKLYTRSPAKTLQLHSWESAYGNILLPHDLKESLQTTDGTEFLLKRFQRIAFIFLF